MSSRSLARQALRTRSSQAPIVNRAAIVKKSLARNYASGPSASKSNNGVIFGGLGVAALAGAYYFYSQQNPSSPAAAPVKKAHDSYSSKPKDAATAEEVDYQKVYNAVADLLDAGDEEYDDGSYGPVLIRLAWHASGTYDKETGGGGSNGATMRFAPEANHGANAGLVHARDRLEKVHEQFPQITYSDLWTLAGVAAVQEMNGPKIPWKPGRQDGYVENCTPDGRLPDGDKGSDHLRKIFYRQGFNDQEIVALSGAHALGRCHADRSGFEGNWTFSPITFTNDYFQLLFDEKWKLRDPKKGPIQYEDVKTKSLMMLTTDMALVTDKTFRKTAEAYAKDEGLFFNDFSKVFAKLLENGVPKQNFEGKPTFYFKTIEEQQDAAKA